MGNFVKVVLLAKSSTIVIILKIAGKVRKI